ncbi:transporter [Tropicimonas sp. S265A]|uniref:transporter n=1 Tax=Tropicimonas sp. S265A TaxID=3415134 RepID=UPI003C797373
MKSIAHVSAAFLAFAAGPVWAQASSSAELAQQLSNPIADLISAPIQLNYDENIGADDSGSRWTTNIQPVIPFSISDDWNVISRTILPVVSTDGIPSGSGSKEGLGDTVQSFFFSPKALTSTGWTWGVGPVFLLPTSTDDRFGAGEWGVGLTGVALKQQGPWTFGGLANHIVDVDGDTDINATFLQPFLAYNTPNAWTFTVNSESTYDWEAEEWAVPVNFIVSKLTSFGGQPVSLGVGARYWAESATNGPEDWGARFILTFLFPK